MTTFVNNDVASGNVIYASDHNTQGALLAAVLNGGIDANNLSDSAVTTAKIADSNVTTDKLPDAAITPAKLFAGTGTSWTWQSWTPTWTNFTVSSSSVVAVYIQIGKSVFYRISVTLAGGNTPSGAVTYTLPVAASSTYVNDTASIGTVSFLDTGVQNYIGFSKLATTTTGNVLVYNASTTYITASTISATIPHAWGNGDILAITGFYEAA